MKNYGLLGASLGHSLSPLIHNTVFAHKKEAAAYTLLEVPEERLPLILGALHTLNFCGINITIPYKKGLIPYFDEIRPEAKAIGAVNTVKLEGGRSCAYNTDYSGFGFMLEQAGLSVKNKSLCILGTGGASLAAAAFGADHGSKNIVFLSRRGGGELLGCPVLPYSATAKGDMVINATPLGMFPNTEASPLDARGLSLFESAVDLIYRPLETKFLREAKKLGLKTAGGLDMLIGQALEAQKIWNGWDFPSEFYHSLKKQLESSL